MMSARGGSAASRTALSKSAHRNWAWFGTALEDTSDKDEPMTSAPFGVTGRFLPPSLTSVLCSAPREGSWPAGRRCPDGRTSTACPRSSGSCSLQQVSERLQTDYSRTAEVWSRWIPGLDTLVMVFRKYWNSVLRDERKTSEKYFWSVYVQIIPIKHGF